MAKKILVTGADGFIGSHLCEELIKSGYRVKAFVFYNSFNSWGWLDTLAPSVLAQIEIFQGDVRDPNGVRNAVKGCDAVLHLAALIAIPFSYHSPDSYIDTNVKGTLNILQAARDFNIEKVIHTSTSEVYGTAQYVPIDERHPICGQSPYSATKIAADQLAYSFYASFQLPVSIVRPFNTYGPRQSARAIIPTIITQIAAGQRHIKLGALHPTRDFSFVADTAKGFVAALSADNIAGETFNLGSQFEISMEDTANAIAEVMSADIDIVTDTQRLRPADSEVERLFASHQKARSTLDWQPEYLGLEGFKRGLKQTADWFVQPENLKHYKSHLYNV